MQNVWVMMITLFETSCIFFITFFFFFNFLFIIYLFPQELKENEFVSKDLEQLKSNNNTDYSLPTLDEFDIN